MNSEQQTVTGEKSSLFRCVWILSDGKVGDLVQCEGVALALGVKTKTIIVSPGAPWVWMMPRGPLPAIDRIGQVDSPLQPPFPDLVIASGWRTLAYVRALKQHLGDKVFTVFLKSPRCRAPYVDLIWVPLHDRLRGNNVISSLAGPHGNSPDRLARIYARKPDFMKQLPAPLVGVLLGGDSKDYHFTNEDCIRLAHSLRSLAKNGAGLAITPSRRTPDSLRKTISEELSKEKIYWWDEKTANPYGYILAHSDYFVITTDSANMIGEACVLGKPVYTFRPSGGSRKFDRLLEGFAAHGATKPLPERIDKLQSWSYEPLYAASQIAGEIEKRAFLQLRKK